MAKINRQHLFSFLTIVSALIVLMAQQSDNKATCDTLTSTGIVVIRLESDYNLSTQICENRELCDLTIDECLASAFRSNGSQIFGAQEDLTKWYVEVKTDGFCADGSGFTRKFIAGSNMDAQLTQSGTLLELLPSSNEMVINSDIDFNLVIRAPCLRHTGTCGLCTSTRRASLFDASTRGLNVRANRTILMMPDPIFDNSPYTGCDCIL